ncbi:MAG: hypothetical protein NTX76_03150 [Alphaproteobacteria bacterium]|nr:hypothetical protein [Alphaproteobacteria bacterium]
MTQQRKFYFSALITLFIANIGMVNIANSASYDGAYIGNVPATTDDLKASIQILLNRPYSSSIHSDSYANSNVNSWTNLQLRAYLITSQEFTTVMLPQINVMSAAALAASSPSNTTYHYPGPGISTNGVLAVQDVVNAYRSVLCRNPESSDVVYGELTARNNYLDMLRDFTGSYEFGTMVQNDTTPSPITGLTLKAAIFPGT